MRSQLIIVPTLVVLATPAFGVELSAACKPVLTAMEKTLQTDHATMTTDGTRTIKGVTVGGVVYVQIRGAWTKSPMSVKDSIAQSRENLRNARDYTCKPQPDSSVDGVSVANYLTHTADEDTVVDGTVAIDKRSGLAVRVENILKTGPVGAHYVTHYTYGGIKAPM